MKLIFDNGTSSAEKTATLPSTLIIYPAEWKIFGLSFCSFPGGSSSMLSLTKANAFGRNVKLPMSNISKKLWRCAGNCRLTY
jgi:hypothetical protein